MRFAMDPHPAFAAGSSAVLVPDGYCQIVSKAQHVLIVLMLLLVQVGGRARV
jgi:hypothetical protein